jgi:hypothetical protein
MGVSSYAAIAIDLKVLLKRQVKTIANFISSTDKIIAHYLDLSYFYRIIEIFYTFYHTVHKFPYDN